MVYPGDAHLTAQVRLKKFIFRKIHKKSKTIYKTYLHEFLRLEIFFLISKKNFQKKKSPIQERSDLCYLAFPDSNSSPTAQRCSPTIKGRSAMSWSKNIFNINFGFFLKKFLTCPKIFSPSDSTHHFRIRRSVASEDEEEPEGSEAPCF